MNVAQKVVFACCLFGAPNVSLAVESPNLVEIISTIDTSIPFAPGAEEHLINVRGPFGQPSFQQGFVDGMHFRIDPDGGALFSRDPRLRNNVFEVECENGIVSCIAMRGAVRLSVDPEGLLTFALDEEVVFDTIYVGFGLFDLEQSEDNWKKLNTSLDTVSVDVLAGYDQMVAVKDGKLVQQIPLEGILVVGTYLKWVNDGQPVKVLPASWQDAHEEETAPGYAPNANVPIDDGISFQSKFKNDWAIYSPLLQFDDESFESTPEGACRYGDPEMGLGAIAPVQVNVFAQIELGNPKHDDQFVFGIEPEALEPAIDLAKLSLDELGKLQHQLDGSLQPDNKLINVANVEENSAADLNSYVSNLDIASGAIKPEPDREIISVLMASVSFPTNVPQHKEITADPVSSTKK